MILFFSIVILSSGGILNYLAENRYSASKPEEGISIVHSENILLSDISIDFYATDHPQYFDIRGNFTLIDQESGVIFLTLPYSGKGVELNPNWQTDSMMTNGYRIMYKQFPCVADDPCKNSFNLKSYLLKDISEREPPFQIIRIPFVEKPTDSNVEQLVKSLIPETTKLVSWLATQKHPTARIIISSDYDEFDPIPPATSKVGPKDDEHLGNYDTFSWSLENNKNQIILKYSDKFDRDLIEYRNFLTPVLFSIGSVLLIAFATNILTENRNKILDERSLE